jgi:Porin PorA
MRRDIGMILAGLGMFLIVIAVVVPTYIAGQVIKFPQNYYYKAILNSPDTTYFSAAKVKEVTGAHVQAIYTLKGDAKAANSSTAVWDLFTYIYDTGLPPGPAQEIQIQTRTFAFDRKSAELQNCCGHNLNGKAYNESGVVGYVFPMNTQQKTYQIYDTTLLRPVPFTYAGTDNVDGVHTYKFNENVAPTKIGFSQLSSTEPEFYAINLTYWVDPDTGALLKVNEHQQMFLENAITGQRTTTLFDGTFAPTPASVSAIVAIDNSGRLKKTLIETVLPIVAGVLGAVLLVWGILLGRKRRRDFTASGLDAMTRALAAAPPPDDEGASASHAVGGKHAFGSADSGSSQAADSEGAAGVVPGMGGSRKAAEHGAEGENPDAAGGPATRLRPDEQEAEHARPIRGGT